MLLAMVGLSCPNRPAARASSAATRLGKGVSPIGLTMSGTRGEVIARFLSRREGARRAWCVDRDDHPRPQEAGDGHGDPAEQVHAGREPVPAVDVDAEEDRLRKNENPSMAKPRPNTLPNVAVKFGQSTPISKLSTVPVITPIANRAIITRLQRRAIVRYSGSPVHCPHHSTSSTITGSAMPKHTSGI